MRGLGWAGRGEVAGLWVTQLVALGLGGTLSEASCAWRGSVCLARLRLVGKDQGQFTPPSEATGVLPTVLREGLLGGTGTLRLSWQPGISQMALGRVKGLSEDRVLFLLCRKSASHAKPWTCLTSTPHSVLGLVIE